MLTWPTSLLLCAGLPTWHSVLEGLPQHRGQAKLPRTNEMAGRNERLLADIAVLRMERHRQ